MALILIQRRLSYSLYCTNGIRVMVFTLGSQPATAVKFLVRQNFLRANNVYERSLSSLYSVLVVATIRMHVHCICRRGLALPRIADVCRSVQFYQRRRCLCVSVSLIFCIILTVARGGRVRWIRLITRRLNDLTVCNRLAPLSSTIFHRSRSSHEPPVEDSNRIRQRNRKTETQSDRDTESGRHREWVCTQRSTACTGSDPSRRVVEAR